MDDLQAPATSLENEDDWIEKYRAALDAAPDQRSRSERYRAVFDNLIDLFFPMRSRITQRSVQTIWDRARTAVHGFVRYE